MPDDINPLITQIDTPGPEDDPSLNISKVTDLTVLSSLAQSNTSKIRQLQRLQLKHQEDGPDFRQTTEIINRRQLLSRKLIRQRDSLRKVQEDTRKKTLEETLRPSAGILNNRNRHVLEEMIKTYESVKTLRVKYIEQTATQRRLAARLKQWESTYLMLISALDKLPPLPSELE